MEYKDKKTGKKKQWSISDFVPDHLEVPKEVEVKSEEQKQKELETAVKLIAASFPKKRR